MVGSAEGGLVPGRRRGATMGRRDSLRLLGGAALGAALTSVLGCKAPPPRHVVAITADDLRLDELAYLPNLQALAGRGITFTNARVPTPMCTPSRVGFLTGRLANGPHGTGSVNQTTGLAAPLRAAQLPLWLSAAGVRTGIVGKYLTAPLRPFHDVDGWSSIGTLYGSGAADAFDYTIWDGTTTSAPIAGQRAEDRLADMARAFLADASQPSFLWWCSSAPHTPLQPRPEDADAFQGVVWPCDPAEDVSTKPTWVRDLPVPDALAIGLMQAFEVLRLAELAELDRHVGDLVAWLEATGRLADTLVLLWSDNGDAMFEHRLPMLGKGAPHDVCMRVPLLMAGRGLPAGVTNDTPVSVPDLTATVLGALGADPSPALDGTSLLQIAAAPSHFADRAILGHCAAPGPGSAAMPTCDVVVTAEAKLIRYHEPVGGFADPTDRFELYDLVADPGELVNLAWDPGHLAQRGALEGRLDALLATGQG